MTGNLEMLPAQGKSPPFFFFFFVMLGSSGNVIWWTTKYRIEDMPPFWIESNPEPPGRFSIQKAIFCYSLIKGNYSSFQRYIKCMFVFITGQWSWSVEMLPMLEQVCRVWYKMAVRQSRVMLLVVLSVGSHPDRWSRYSVVASNWTCSIFTPLFTPMLYRSLWFYFTF